MNTIRINKVVTKLEKCFQGVYPIGLLQSTLIKLLIIAINFDKDFIPGSHWAAVCISDSGYAEYFDSYALPPYKFEFMAFLQQH